MSREPRIVHEFEAARGTIRTAINQFGGKTYVDLRLWVEPRDRPGDLLIPTKRGLSVPIDFLDDLEEALAAVRNDAAPSAHRTKHAA